MKTGSSYTVSIPPKFMRVLGIMPADSIVMMLMPNKILALTEIKNVNALLEFREDPKNYATSPVVEGQSRTVALDPRAVNPTPIPPQVDSAQ